MFCHNFQVTVALSFFIRKFSNEAKKIPDLKRILWSKLFGALKNFDRNFHPSLMILTKASENWSIESF